MGALRPRRYRRQRAVPADPPSCAGLHRLADPRRIVRTQRDHVGPGVSGPAPRARGVGAPSRPAHRHRIDSQMAAVEGRGARLRTDRDGRASRAALEMTAGSDPGRVLILGAGPTGLGAAYRLQELGFDNFQILESSPSPGGLAASAVDPEGFTWDLGGHVQFSHYAYYDAVLDTALADEWLWHDRESWVWLRGRFVPYPFQNNIHRLEREDMEHALRGLEHAAARRRSKPAANFGDWIHTTFGEGIAQMFLYPYNFKVWGVPPEHMGVGWMGERVAIPDIARIRKNIAEQRDDVSWGPNNRFRFPRRGGTGAIWQRVGEVIHPAHRLFEHRMIRIDPSGRTVTVANGRTMRYDTLITSVPLDVLVESCDGLSAQTRRAAETLVHSAV